MQEELLVELCKNKDKEAMEVLYRNYYPILFVVASRYIPDTPLAQDVVHDCFIKIFTSLDKFTYRGNGSLKAWLCRLTANKCIEIIRKQQKNITTSITGQDYKLEEAVENELEQIPKATLLNFIKELPDGYRTIFNLYVFENFSHKEIAKKLGINEKSSSSQLARAKATLAKKIKDYLKANMN